MIDLNDFEKNLKILREKYTFDADKRNTFEREKKVRSLMARKDLKDMDGIKQLVAELIKRVKDISVLLSWDKKMTEADRQAFFKEREAYQWVVGFFVEPEKIITKIVSDVRNEVKHLGEE